MELKPSVLLMSMSTWLIAVTFAILYLLISRIRLWYRLRHIKGPFWAAFSKWWMMRKTMGGRMHLQLARVCDQYGPLARIGPDYLVTSDPNVLRRIWAVRSPYVRSDWYDAMRLDPSKDNVLSERDDLRHSELRSKLATGYSGKENDQLEQCIDNQVSSLVKLIETNYISTGSEYHPLEFARKAQFFTLDVITAIAFGDAFGYLTKDEDIHQYIKTTQETLPAIIMVGVFPWLNKVLQSRFMKIFLPSDKDALGLGKVMGIAKQVVASRYGSEKETTHDMLGSFIRHGITQAEAESECLVQILAGSDTTATAIRMTMLHIITSPKAYSKLQAEIDAATDRQQISSPIIDAEAKSLPYLQACIKEGLRIWPPVTGLVSKEAPQGGDFIHGQFIPGGTKVAYCAWGVFRDKTIWGDDADSFRPERWLQADDEKLKTMENTAEILFAPGRWQCLGKSIALIELNKVFVELLRRFDFSLISLEDPISTYNVGIFIQSKMFFRVTKRNEA